MVAAFASMRAIRTNDGTLQATLDLDRGLGVSRAGQGCPRLSDHRRPSPRHRHRDGSRCGGSHDERESHRNGS